MRVKFHTREIEARAEPMKGGYFLKCGHPAAAGIAKGDEIEVNAAKLEVQYVIAFSLAEWTNAENLRMSSQSIRARSGGGQWPHTRPSQANENPQSGQRVEQDRLIPWIWGRVGKLI